MPRDQKTLLLAQAAKNPDLQKLVDTANSMSVEEIDQLSIAKWMRDGLIRIKRDADFKDFEAFVLSNTIETFGEDFDGNLIRWDNEEVFMTFGKSELLVNLGDLLFITERGVWLDTAFTDKPDPRLSTCSVIKVCKFTEYRLEVRKMLNIKYGNIEKPARKGLTVKKWSGEYPE